MGPERHHHVPVSRARPSTLARSRTRDRPQQPDPDSGPLEHRADHLRRVPSPLPRPDVRKNASGSFFAFWIRSCLYVKKNTRDVTIATLSRQSESECILAIKKSKSVTTMKLRRFVYFWQEDINVWCCHRIVTSHLKLRTVLWYNNILFLYVLHYSYMHTKLVAHYYYCL